MTRARTTAHRPHANTLYIQKKRIYIYIYICVGLNGGRMKCVANKHVQSLAARAPPPHDDYWTTTHDGRRTTDGDGRTTEDRRRTRQRTTTDGGRHARGDDDDGIRRRTVDNGRLQTTNGDKGRTKHEQRRQTAT